MKLVAVLLTVVWAGACAARASGPPSLLIDRSVCSRCGMLISERAYAAAIHWADGSDQLFDDIGCLVAATGQAQPRGARYWFHDAADGEWIVDASPVFVLSPDLKTPMGGGIVAYRNAADAERTAGRYSGRIVRDVAGLKTPDRSIR